MEAVTKKFISIQNVNVQENTKNNTNIEILRRMIKQTGVLQKSQKRSS